MVVGEEGCLVRRPRGGFFRCFAPHGQSRDGIQPFVLGGHRPCLALLDLGAPSSLVVLLFAVPPLLPPNEDPSDTQAGSTGVDSRAGPSGNIGQHPLSKGKGKKLQKNLFVLQLWLK